ncbi:T9SS type A sorting domain-containing protein [uncultured Flavobacterium sp.]|uniref:T9SS type A sorting domain-containing protein n=1 Tax=uncultured Flavobacterium sp. TaxID=165435 RepID=UPI0025FF410C|nr:T9SS type A sorting domain-containing protein [uncultured Flavobacterium sp.]
MKINYLKSLLLAALLPTAIYPQDVYNVESINYQVYPAALPFLDTNDDEYSEVFSIPFDFTYFGNTYNHFRVSTNGYINFSTEVNSHSPWQLFSSYINPVPLTAPGENFPVKNSILGCFHDMDNTSGYFDGSITWSVTGNAPYRRFVLMFNRQPHYGNSLNGSCITTKQSSFQIIMYETLNYIDVQVTQKDLCTGWNQGFAVIGLINDTGLVGYTAPGRNTSVWEVTEGNGEGWRFRPEIAPAYRYIKCDPENDGFEAFELSVIQADLGASATIYLTEEEAGLQENAITGTAYTNNTTGQQMIYARVGNEIIPVMLSTVDCSLPFDNDTVAAMDEDLNGDGNLANDDTDGDGLPDFADDDDDGDLVLTSEEYVFGRDASDELWDTDNDGIPNYLDDDDDNDGVLTADEDYNHNGNAADDDTDESGIADYLEANVTMGVKNPVLQNVISLYPNPVSDVLNINNQSGKDITGVEIYSVNGVLVKHAISGTSLNVADLQSGIYFVKIQVSSQILNYKFIKK